MGDRVSVLHPDQVWDISRTCFFIGLKATAVRHLGEIVYEDDCGRRLIIVERP